jgi:hypothetical protein
MFFIPVLVAGAIGTAVYKAHTKKGLTPERKKVYEALMNSARPPAEYEKMAVEFEKNGLTTEADMLRKRAKLAAASPEEKAEHNAVYKKALASTNKEAVLRVANAFHLQGAIGAATSLRKYAAGIPSKVSAAIKGSTKAA